MLLNAARYGVVLGCVVWRLSTLVKRSETAAMSASVALVYTDLRKGKHMKGS